MMRFAALTVSLCGAAGWLNGNISEFQRRDSPFDPGFCLVFCCKYQ